MVVYATFKIISVIWWRSVLYYTDICKFKEDRSTLCKFRISAHSLEIEKGSYYNIPRENRVCLSCKAGKVEDELHLFLDRHLMHI